MLKKPLLAACCVLFSLSMLNAHADVLDTQLQSSIQQYVHQHQKSDHLSAVQLSVLLPGNPVPRDYVAGMQYYESPTAQIHVPATTTMMMQWGSITKEYTSMLIYQLIKAGKVKPNGQPLQTNDTLISVLPNKFVQSNSDAWPQSWAKITLVQLMNMTSGIPSYDIDTNLDQAQQYSMDDLVDIAAKQTQRGCTFAQGCFPGGASWYYSNTNYIILGLIVEQYTGLSFANAMEQYILTPFRNQELGQPTFVDYISGDYPDNIIAQMIHAYNPTNPENQPGWSDVTYWNTSALSSAGAMLGNMNSLTKITRALFAGQLGIDPKSTLEQNMIEVSNGQPVTDIQKQCVGNSPACYAMGLGMWYVPDQGGEIWWYEGGTYGYETIYVWIPSENVIIALSQSCRTQDDPLITLIFQINTDIRKYLHLPTSAVSEGLPPMKVGYHSWN